MSSEFQQRLAITDNCPSLQEVRKRLASSPPRQGLDFLFESGGCPYNGANERSKRVLGAIDNFGVDGSVASSKSLCNLLPPIF